MAAAHQSSFDELSSYPSASSLVQKWTLASREKRLTASAEIVLSGRPGDQFVLLRSPAVLTEFKGEGLRLGKVEVAGQGAIYVITIPASEEAVNKAEVDRADESPKKQFTATFQFQLEAVQPTEGIPVLTGKAACNKLIFVTTKLLGGGLRRGSQG